LDYLLAPARQQSAASFQEASTAAPWSVPETQVGAEASVAAERTVTVTAFIEGQDYPVL
jgi:hypothetical protein